MTTTDSITYGKPIPVDPDGVHKDTVARLLVDGQPATDPVDVPAGKVVAFQAGVRNQPPKPPASEWPEFAYAPGDFSDTIEINDNLAATLRSMGQTLAKLIVLHERCIPQLAEIAETEPVLLGGNYFTVRPDEFHQHALSFNSEHDFDGAGFQGFRITNPGGIGLRFTGTGMVVLRCSEIVKCGQGIAVTGPHANMDIWSSYNRYDEFIEFGGHPQAVYLNRGRFHTTEDVISQIGHLRGDPRLKDSQYNHAFYIQREGRITAYNTWIEDPDSHGINCRGGFSIDGIVVVRPANGIGVGNAEDVGMVEGTINRAIVVNAEDLQERKTGICIAAERASINISNSLLADEKSAGDGSAFRLYDEARVELGDNVRTQGLPRVFDVSGSNTYANGRVRTASPVPRVVNQRSSASNHSGSVAAEIPTPPLALPDFDRMTAPKPGYVGALIDSILEQGASNAN